jgi:FtsH-binding integral membrane protein
MVEMDSSLSYGQGVCVADAAPSERASFIRCTYANLAGAIVAFAIIEAYLLSLPIAQEFAALAENRYVWLGILGGYMFVSWIAEQWAQTSRSLVSQYLALTIYIVAEAILFVPLLLVANTVSPDIIPIATLITGGLTCGLTLVVLSTRRDFSFLRNFVVMGGFVALGLIVGSAIFGFGLGMIFSGAMIILACACILYSTHKVLTNYNTNQPVAAALCLFAAIALLFWYIVRILIQIYAAAQGD